MFLPHPLSLAPVGRLPTTGVLAKGFGHSLLARPVVGYCTETLRTQGISANNQAKKNSDEFHNFSRVLVVCAVVAVHVKRVVESLH